MGEEKFLKVPIVAGLVSFKCPLHKVYSQKSHFLFGLGLKDALSLFLDLILEAPWCFVMCCIFVVESSLDLGSHGHSFDSLPTHIPRWYLGHITEPG